MQLWRQLVRTLECAHATLVGALASRGRHGHHIPLHVQQEVAQINADLYLIGRIC